MSTFQKWEDPCTPPAPVEMSSPHPASLVHSTTDVRGMSFVLIHEKDRLSFRFVLLRFVPQNQMPAPLEILYHLAAQSLVPHQ